MLDKSCVLGLEDIEHDLHEENKHIFGISLDLFNGNHTYYCKVIGDGRRQYYDLPDDIYKAIYEFNSILKENSES